MCAFLTAILPQLLPPSVHAQAVASPTTSSNRPSKESTLIPRSVLFGNPQKASARVSPNGKWLSFLAPVDGILNVWVAPIDDIEAAKPITEDKVRDIRGHSWAYTGKHVLHAQDVGGNEDFHVYATNVESGETKDITPVDNVQARILQTSPRFPNEILIGLNNRVPQLHDIYRVNIETGERELIQENFGLAAFVTDDDFRVRFGFTFTPDGGQLLLKAGRRSKTGAQDGWDEFMKAGPEDAMTTGPAGFDKSGKILYVQDSRDRDTGGLFAINIETGETTLLADAHGSTLVSSCASDRVHGPGRRIHLLSHRVEDSRRGDQADLEYLETVEDGELIVTSRTLDDQWWTVAYMLDNGPLKFYLYDRAKKECRFLFSSRDDLDDYQLAKMHTPVIKSRDGLNLVSYLTVPLGTDSDGDGRPEKPLPMVLDVHGALGAGRVGLQLLPPVAG